MNELVLITGILLLAIAALIIGLIGWTQFFDRIFGFFKRIK